MHFYSMSQNCAVENGKFYILVARLYIRVCCGKVLPLCSSGRWEQECLLRGAVERSRWGASHGCWAWCSARSVSLLPGGACRLCRSGDALRLQSDEQGSCQQGCHAAGLHSGQNVMRTALPPYPPAQSPWGDLVTKCSVVPGQRKGRR